MVSFLIMLIVAFTVFVVVTVITGSNSNAIASAVASLIGMSV